MQSIRISCEEGSFVTSIVSTHDSTICTSGCSL